MHYTFGTPKPVDLVVEIGAGSVEVRATDTEESEVSVEGERADEVTVKLSGDTLSVIAPKKNVGFGIGRSREIRVRATVPSGSSLNGKVGSADVTVEGPLNAARVRSGSGDVTFAEVHGPTDLAVGSGDVRIENAESHVRVKSGSGDVTISRAGATVGVVTGSGDVVLDSVVAAATVKSGSGSLTINSGAGELDLTCASGDITVSRVSDARIRAKNASGDISVSVPAATPVWTDVSSVSGHVRSSLQSVGAAQDGQPHVRVTARTISGDVSLQNI